MKKFSTPNINTPEYFDTQFKTKVMPGNLRQKVYLNMAGHGNRIIELGCGVSPFLEMAVGHFNEVYGLDFAPKTIQRLRRKALSKRRLSRRINYICADACHTPFEDGFFDVVVSGEVIEHIEEPEKLVAEMVRISKHKVILSTPHLEFTDPEHLWEFEPDDIFLMLKKYGDVSMEIIHSEMFPGRAYIIACLKKR